MNKVAANNLIKAREQQKLTQRELAKMLGTALKQTYSIRQYQKLEEGRFPIYKKEIVEELDKILNTGLYELIYEENVPRDTVSPKPHTDSLQPRGTPDYRDDVIALLKEKINSDRRLFLYAQTNQALLKTVVQTLAKIQSKLDKRKLAEVQVEMNNQLELHLQALRKADT